jgi:signal transduction histidine kinase
LSTGEVLVVPNIEAYRNDGGAYRDHLSGMHSCIVAPIRFHGAVIGAVNIEWKPGFRFSLTARRRILSFAETIAPYADQLRQLAAVDLCNTRFAKEELDRPLSLERPAGTWLSIVRDILGVPGAALSIDVGFGPPRVAVCDRSICTQVDDMEAAQAFLGCLEGHVREPLRIGSLQIGELLLCVSKASLGAEPFVRDAVSSLVANGVLDAARVQHAHVLNQMQIDLGKTGLRDEGGWSQVLTTAAESMHFEWLVVANSEGCVCLESPHSDAIEALLAAGDLGKEVNPLPTPVGSARCALRIDLPETDRVLLLGFGKTDFGVELSPTYPWRIFVDRFRESADAALVRIRSAQALLRSQKEAFMYQASAQMVATAGSLAHQAVNLSRDISSSAHNVREAILTGEVQVSPSVERAVIALGRSTRNLHALMSGIRRIEVFDEKCPCDVSDAFRMVRRQHETTIFERGAKLTFPESLLPQVNVPLHALTLALSNLVDNACDAFKRAKSQKRHIEITADWWGDRLQLRVADTGPGVDPELAGRIFDPGISCKPQSGGWGLYLVRECLRHYDARIELQPQCEGGAVFVINLPAQEERES